VNALILTGWGLHDYAYAAALALRHLVTAEVVGVSRRKLPEMLAELAATEKLGYERIEIIGVSLAEDPESLMASLEVLSRRGVKVTWLSVMTMAKSIPGEIKNYIDVVIKPGLTLAAAVAEHYGLPPGDLLPPPSPAGKSSANLWARLIDAAMFQYRCLQDRAAYAEAIGALSRKDFSCPLERKQQLMIEHYERHSRRELKGHSAAMDELRAIIDKVAPKDRAGVLIHGESGTGKETVAILLHLKSGRGDEPFIEFNCATMAPQLFEDRLFGHSRGAFTGADKDEPGAFAKADKGTLFLDEVGELSLDAQALLLRVLQEKRFRRLGDGKESTVDVRIIAATNRDLPRMVKEGKFREDLFYRLCVIPVRVPPLREHAEDIDDIANDFRHRRQLPSFSRQQLDDLKSHQWPGNVRELLNFLERSMVLEESDFKKGLGEHRSYMAPMSESCAAPDNLEAMTRLHALAVLKKYAGNISRASQAMGISRNTLKKHLVTPCA